MNTDLNHDVDQADVTEYFDDEYDIDPAYTKTLLDLTVAVDEKGNVAGYTTNSIIQLSGVVDTIAHTDEEVAAVEETAFSFTAEEIEAAEKSEEIVEEAPAIIFEQVAPALVADVEAKTETEAEDTEAAMFGIYNDNDAFEYDNYATPRSSLGLAWHSIKESIAKFLPLPVHANNLH